MHDNIDSDLSDIIDANIEASMGEDDSYYQTKDRVKNRFRSNRYLIEDPEDLFDEYGQ